jgi:hypothetical protein
LWRRRPAGGFLLCRAPKKNAGKMPAPQFADRTLSKPRGFFSRCKV